MPDVDHGRIAARVRGTIRYTLDVALDGMLHAALVRSHEPAGAITAIDTTIAAAMPGVRRIVTAADVAALGLADTRFGTIEPDQPILAADRVRHVGEPVAAVVAVTPAAAIAAAAAVEVRIEPAPFVLDAEAALAAGAPLVHEDRPGNVLGRTGYSHGDLADAERRTILRHVATYTGPAAQQVTFETQVCVARWTDDGLELWAATQSPSRVATEVARVFGLEAARVRLHVRPLGGGYGGKNHAKHEPLVAALARLAGRPVRLANTRAEEFVTTTKHAATVVLDSGIDGDGLFTYRRARIRWTAGAYAHSSPAVMRAGALVVCGPYRVPAAEVESVMACTNVPPAGSFRGLGANQAAWAGESQVDELAALAGLDPLEFRRRNVVRPGDRLPTGERVADAHWLACLEVAEALVETDRAGPARAGDPRRRTGTAIALAMKHTMTPSRSEATLAAMPDGTVEVRSSLVDMGQGLGTVLARAAARALDLDEALVRVVDPDTATTPYDATTSSSRGTWSGTMAVTNAATSLHKRLAAAAAAILEAPPEAVRIVGSRVVVAETGADTGLDLGALVRRSGVAELAATGAAVNEALVDETGAAANSSHWHQGAVGIRAAVDPETGGVAIEAAVGTAWAGRVVDGRRATLQVEGGIVFGIGPALFEELVFPDGHPSRTTLLDYRIPSGPDVPPALETRLLEGGPDAEPTGLGESVTPAVAPALAGAIAAATGARIRTLPMTPDRVLGALTGAELTAVPRAADTRIVLAAGSPEPPAETAEIELEVDGVVTPVRADPLASLRSVLADDLGIRAVREPCGVGACGACTVLVDGRPVRSCLQAVGLVAGRPIVTPAGLAADDPVVRAFVAAGAAQCGSCIPGAVLGARGLLARDPAPDAAAIRDGLAGHLCRCGTYPAIQAGVRRVRTARRRRARRDGG